MSHLQETAEACERLLIKHEPKQDRVESLRVNVAKLRAEGVRIGYRHEAKKVRLIVVRQPRPPGKARLAAMAWLDQPKPRVLSQNHFAAELGVSQPSVSAAAYEIRRERRLEHLAGNREAMLAGRRGGRAA